MNLHVLIVKALRNQVTSLSNETIDELTQRITQYIESQTELKSVPFGLLAQGVHQASPTIQLMLADQGSSIQDAAQYAFKFVINQVVDDPSSTIPESHWAESNCPYPGLEAFTEATAEYYYGRDEEIEKFLLQIDRPILALTGSSGVGKSSFVSAGVLPRLRERFKETAVYLTFRIHTDVNWLRDFAESLSQEIGQPGDHILDALRKREDALITILKDAFLKEKKRVFLIFDQFETLFVGNETSREADRRCFLDNLLSVETSQEPLFLTAIFATRENFFEHPDYASRRRLGDTIQRENISLLALNDHQLRQAMEQPLNRYNQRHGLTLKFQLGLVDLLIHEFRNPSVSLPLVQYLLRLLWTEKHHLTHFAYNSLGGLERVLDRHALGIYQGFADEDQKLVKAILIALVRPGISGEYTRKRIDRQKLFVSRSPQEQRRIEQILNRLSSAHSRIISEQQIGNTIYLELTHEVILRQWSLLQELIEARKERIEARERLLPKAEVWWASRKTKGDLGNTGELYTGNELRRAGRYVENAPNAEDIDGTISACYKASHQYYYRKLIQNVAAVTGIVLLVAVIVSVLLNRASGADERRATAEALSATEGAQRVTAEAQTEIEVAQRATIEAEKQIQEDTAFARELAAEAVALINANPELALLLSVEAVNLTYQEYGFFTAEAEVALYKVLTLPAYRKVLIGHHGPVRSAMFNHSGTRIITVSDDKTVRLWDGEGNFLTILMDHQGFVTSAAFDPTGDFILTASEEGQVRFWNNSGGLLNTLQGHIGAVRNAIFSPNGQFILTSGDDTTVRIWDSEGSLQRILEGHSDAILATRYAPNGEMFATASRDGTIRLWKANGDSLMVLDAQDYGAYSVTFNEEGSLIAAAGCDEVDAQGRCEQGSVLLWNINGNLINILRRNQGGGLGAVAFNPLDDIIITAIDGIGSIWNLQGEFLTAFPDTQGFISSLNFSNDGNRMLTGGCIDSSLDTSCSRGIVQLWDATGHLIMTLEGHANWVYSAQFNTTETRIVTASRDGTARLWDVDGSLVKQYGNSPDLVLFSPDGTSIISAECDLLADGDCIDAPIRLRGLDGNVKTVFPGHTDRISSIHLSPDGTKLLSTSWDNSARLWNLAGEMLAVLEGHTDIIRDAEFNSDGTLIVTASDDLTAKLWDVNGNLLTSFVGHTDIIYSASFSPNGQIVATASVDDTVRVWSIEGRFLFAITEHSASINTVRFDPTGTLLLTSSWDGTARLWDTNGNLLHILAGHTAVVRMATFNPMGDVILTISDDNTARLWNIDGTLVAILEGHVEPLITASFNQIGNRIITTSYDGTARLWDSNGNLLDVFEDGSWVETTAFSPDGNLLVTGGTNIKLWEVYSDIDIMLAEAARRVGRQLLPTECARYFPEGICP